MAAIFSFLLLVVLASGSSASKTDRPASALDTYIIVIKEKLRAQRGSTGPTEIFMRINLRSNNTKSSHRIPNVRPTYGSYFSLSIGYIAEMNITAFNIVRNLTDIDFIEEDQVGSITQNKWHIDRIDQRDLPLDGGYNPKYTGRGVDIYIIDSGIRYTHEQFKDNNGNTRAYYGNFDVIKDTSPDGSDIEGHGTHVAALAAGKTVGAAKGTNVYSIKIVNSSGRYKTSDLVKALEHVVDRAQASQNRVVMSMSLRGPVSSSVNLCIKIANRKGIISVVAAGNDGDDACNWSPASAEYAITVGGTERDDDLYSKTNYGSCVDIFAPGVNVRSASHTSDISYTYKTGTSMAAPIVSGAVAMLLEEDPSLTPLEVKDKLIRRSTQNALDLTTVAFFVTPNRLVYVEPRYSQFGNLGSTTVNPQSICHQWYLSLYHYYIGYLRDLYRNHC